MAKVGTAEYDVEINQAAVRREVAQASTTIERGLGDASRKVRSEFDANAKAAIGGFGLFVAGKFLADSIQAASNLAEQQAKVGQVFGDSVGQVEDFASAATKSIGQSERSALEAAGTFGNLFRGIGLAEDQSAKFSITLTKLASDLASFNNTSVDDALTALRAGLVGETEPLKRYGINLNDVTLKAKALEMGLYDGVGVLDVSAKAQAAYSVILEQSALAQGDFARTSDSLANQQRILSAQFEDTKATLGEALLPAAQATVEVLTAMLQVFTALPQPVQAAAVAYGAVVIAAGVLLPALRAGRAELALMTATTSTATTASTAHTAALFAEAQACASYGTVMTATTAKAGGLSAIVTKLGGAAGIAQKGFLGAVAGLIAYQQTIDILTNASAFKGDQGRAVSDLEAVGTGAKDASEAFKEFGGSAEALKDKIDIAFQNSGNVERIKAVGDAIFGGVDGTDALVEIGQAESDIIALDEALAGLSEQNPSAAYFAYAKVIQELGLSANLASQLFPEYAKVLRDTTAAEIEGYNAAREGSDADHEAARAAEARAKAERVLRDNVIARFEAERQEFDLTRNLRDAQRDSLQAFQDVAIAEAAAAGNSVEYRNALDAIEDAERGVQDAQRASADAAIDLADARKRAAENLQQLQFQAEGAALSEERARFRLDDAIAAEKEALSDPAATAREKAEATLTRREAELALREAQDRRGDSATAALEADRLGIEGSKEVQSAKERVAEAALAEADAVDRVAEANEAAAKVLEEAKADEAAARKVLEDAILDEADAAADLALETGNATDAQAAYLEGLLKWAEQLDPNSAFRQNLLGYIDDLGRINGFLPDDPSQNPGLVNPFAPNISDPNSPLNPSNQWPTFPDGPLGGPYGSLAAGGEDPLGGVGMGPGKVANLTTNNITVHNGPGPKEIADALAFSN